MADEKAWLTTARLEALSDGIFAFAMTLLVLSISLPDDPTHPDYVPDINLYQLLVGEWRRFLNYAIAFLLLASFWMTHTEQFHLIQATEQRHIWINMVFLMFVSLTPFSTTLIGDYDKESLSWLFFGMNMFVLGSLLLLSWWHASKGLMRSEITRERIRAGIRRCLVVPTAAAISVCAAYLGYVTIAGLAYFLIPVVLMHPYFKEGKK